MSEPTTATDHETYSPISRLEERSQRLSELLGIFVVLAGFLLQNDRLGVVAGVIILVCWLFLQVEFTFAAGILAAAGLGDPLSIGTVLTLAGLGGLLAVDVARTWRSVGVVALFLVLFVVGTGGLLVGSQLVELRLLGVGAAVVLGGLAYVCHRYERVRFSTMNTEVEAIGGGDGATDRSSADRDAERSEGETR